MMFPYIVRRTRLFVMMLSVSLLMAVFIMSSASAADIAAVWVPGSAEAVFSDPDSGIAPSKETLKVGQKFYDFCKRWIGSKNEYALQNVRIQTTGSTSVKEFSQCADPQEMRITKAQGSPVYVGTLKYVEKVYRTSAEASAQREPECVAVASEMPVTEIFMYVDGQWRY